jgi:hypothetical protein
MYSPLKRISFSDGIGDEPPFDACRSLRNLMELTANGPRPTDWTFTTVHEGSTQVQAHAKLSCLLAIHDCQWTGSSAGNQAVPEQWNIFPGPLFSHFRDRFFNASCKTKDVIKWTRSEY